MNEEELQPKSNQWAPDDEGARTLSTSQAVKKEPWV